MPRRKNTSAPPVGRCKAELQKQGAYDLKHIGTSPEVSGNKNVRMFEGTKDSELYKFLCFRTEGSDRITIKQQLARRGNPAEGEAVIGLLVAYLLGFIAGKAKFTRVN